LLLTRHRRPEPPALPGSQSPRGPHSDICGVAHGGVKWRSKHVQSAGATGPAIPTNSGSPRAGGTGIEPAPCSHTAHGALSSVVQGCLALPLNTWFLAMTHPVSSRNIQPLCSQFCSQPDLHPCRETAIS